MKGNPRLLRSPEDGGGLPLSGGTLESILEEVTSSRTLTGNRIRHMGRGQAVGEDASSGSTLHPAPSHCHVQGQWDSPAGPRSHDCAYQGNTPFPGHRGLLWMSNVDAIGS